jgi:hypothetical protein
MNHVGKTQSSYLHTRTPTTHIAIIKALTARIAMDISYILHQIAVYKNGASVIYTIYLVHIQAISHHHHHS